jgi:hypothetical protein
MKTLIALALIIATSSVSFGRSGGHVSGYTRKDGTYVSGYTRGGSSSSNSSTESKPTYSSPTTPSGAPKLDRSNWDSLTEAEKNLRLNQFFEKLAEYNKNSK